MFSENKMKDALRRSTALETDNKRRTRDEGRAPQAFADGSSARPYARVDVYAVYLLSPHAVLCQQQSTRIEKREET
jgi:hypothetical protein